LFLGPLQFWPPATYDRLLTDAGSYDALSAGPRRHPLTITSPWAAGEPGATQQLPYTGQHGTFRLHIGPAPMPTSQTRIELQIADPEQAVEVFLNGIACNQGEGHAYDVPAHAISDGYNLVEVRAEQDVTINWVEIAISP
jgi:hypothetical protein